MHLYDYDYELIDDDKFDIHDCNFNRNGILYVPVSTSDDGVTEEYSRTKDAPERKPDKINREMIGKTSKPHVQTRPRSFASVARSQLRSSEQPKRQEASDYNQLRVTEPSLYKAYEELYGDKLSRAKRLIEDEIIYRPDTPVVDRTVDYPALHQHHSPNKKVSQLRHQQRFLRYIYCFLYTSMLVCLYINQIPNKYIRV